MAMFLKSNPGRSRAHVLSVVCLALLTTLALAPVARAQDKEAEFWVGSYDPDPSALDSEMSFGGRTVMTTSERAAFGLEVGYVDTEGEVTSGLSTGRLNWSAVLVDFISDISLAPGKKVNPVFTIGAGAAFEHADASVSGPLAGIDVEDLDDLSFTVQLGFGVKIGLGKSMFLRPAARVRWFQARSEDDLDSEYLIGVGWRF